MLTILRRHFMQLFSEVARGYAWVSLLPSINAGFLLALLTFLDPTMGAVGLLGAICAWYAGQIAGADAVERPICVFNGLLSGLYVAHVWSFGISVVALATLGGIFSGWLSVVLGRLAWSLVRLPILSMPFALVTMLNSAAGNSLSTLQQTPYAPPPEIFGTEIDKFLSAFGNLYYSPNPFAGLFVMGMIFAFIFFAPWQTISFWFIPIPGILAGVGYLAYSAYMVKKGGDYINHDAHFAGAIYGFLFLIAFEPNHGLTFLNQLLHPQF